MPWLVTRANKITENVDFVSLAGYKATPFRFSLHFCKQSFFHRFKVDVNKYILQIKNRLVLADGSYIDAYL